MSAQDKKNYSKVSGVASRIAQAILESGISQAEIAKKMGCFPTAISRWKTGSTEPTPANLNAIAKVLKIDVNWLMSGKASSNNINEPTEDDMYRLKYEQAVQEILQKDNLIIELQTQLLNSMGGEQKKPQTGMKKKANSSR